MEYDSREVAWDRFLRGIYQGLTSVGELSELVEEDEWVCEQMGDGVLTITLEGESKVVPWGTPE